METTAPTSTMKPSTSQVIAAVEVAGEATLEPTCSSIIPPCHYIATSSTPTIFALDAQTTSLKQSQENFHPSTTNTSMEFNISSFDEETVDILWRSLIENELETPYVEIQSDGNKNVLMPTYASSSGRQMNEERMEVFGSCTYPSLTESNGTMPELAMTTMPCTNSEMPKIDCTTNVTSKKSLAIGATSEQTSGHMMHNSMWLSSYSMPEAQMDGPENIGPNLDKEESQQHPYHLLNSDQNLQPITWIQTQQSRPQSKTSMSPTSDSELWNLIMTTMQSNLDMRATPQAMEPELGMSQIPISGWEKEAMTMTEAAMDSPVTLVTSKTTGGNIPFTFLELLGLIEEERQNEELSQELPTLGSEQTSTLSLTPVTMNSSTGMDPSLWEIVTEDYNGTMEEVMTTATPPELIDLDHLTVETTNLMEESSLTPSTSEKMEKKPKELTWVMSGCSNREVQTPLPLSTEIQLQSQSDQSTVTVSENLNSKDIQFITLSTEDILGSSSEPSKKIEDMSTFGEKEGCQSQMSTLQNHTPTLSPKMKNAANVMSSDQIHLTSMISGSKTKRRRKRRVPNPALKPKDRANGWRKEKRKRKAEEDEEMWRERWNELKEEMELELRWDKELTKEMYYRIGEVLTNFRQGKRELPKYRRKVAMRIYSAYNDISEINDGMTVRLLSNEPREVIRKRMGE